MWISEETSRRNIGRTTAVFLPCFVYFELTVRSLATSLLQKCLCTSSPEFTFSTDFGLRTFFQTFLNNSKLFMLCILHVNTKFGEEYATFV